MEILDIRMRLEQAIENHDRAESSALKSWAIGERTRLRSEVAAGLERMADGEDLGVSVRGHLNIWRYIERMLSQLDSMVDEGGESG